VNNDDERVMPPHVRTELLDLQIRLMELNGYRVESGPTHHLVIMTRNSRRVQLFVDEYGELHWP
jgi:hypothetical protein